MLVVLQIVSHVVITLFAVVALVIRIEHRLTKIETDVVWLIKNNSSGCERKDHDVGENREASRGRTN